VTGVENPCICHHGTKGVISDDRALIVAGVTPVLGSAVRPGSNALMVARLVGLDVASTGPMVPGS